MIILSPNVAGRPCYLENVSLYHPAFVCRRVDVKEEVLAQAGMMNRSKWLILCGALGMFGCAALVASNIAGIMLLERHDWISETISRLAVGKYGWVQDMGLILFALALLACSMGLARWQSGGMLWKAASGLLVLIAVDVVVIAIHNEYGDKDSEKYVIHTSAVIVFGIMFALLPLLLVPKLRGIWRRASIATSILLMILMPIFFFIPTSWDGAYERGLGIIIVGWVVMLCWLLLQRGREQQSRS